MAGPKTHQQLRHEKKLFCNIRTFEDLARTIVCPPRHLFNMVYCGRYKEFEIPKGKGSFRYIETPHQPLKEVQRELNRYLQAVYYFERTPVAYGFMLNALFDKPRNILTNAQQHLGKPFLLNVDLKSFFHQITSKIVFQLFQKKPFYFNQKIASTLTRLTTYKGRLPMGTSTSPVMSNLAIRFLDKALQNMAQQKGWTFTRYVDDLTFSSDQQIRLRDVNRIKRLINNCHFEVNDKKVKLYSPREPKEVTGLMVGSDEVDLPTAFITDTYKEITELAEATALVCRYGKYSEDWLDRLQQRIQGRINFVGFVLHKRSEVYKKLKKAFQQACIPPVDFVPISWSDFSYGNFS